MNRDTMMKVQQRVEGRVALAEPLVNRAGYTAEAYTRGVLDAFVRDTDLFECSLASIERAVINAIGHGLVPDGREGVLVKYRDTCNFQPMIEGRIKRAYNAMPGLALRVVAVYEADEFEYVDGLQPSIYHVPARGQHTPEALAAVYAVGTSPGAEPAFEVMYVEDVERIRARSNARGGPWQSDYVAMAKKTVLGQLLKRMPASAARATTMTTATASQRLVNMDTGEVIGEVEPDEAPLPGAGVDAPAEQVTHTF